jgi:hypothetical protein
LAEGHDRLLASAFAEGACSRWRKGGFVFFGHSRIGKLIKADAEAAGLCIVR